MARFEKANPGGPGRPRGGRNAVNLLLDGIAADGNKAAARLLLNRIWTAPRGRPVPIDLPEIESPATGPEGSSIAPFQARDALGRPGPS